MSGYFKLVEQKGTGEFLQENILLIHTVVVVFSNNSVIVEYVL